MPAPPQTGMHEIGQDTIEGFEVTLLRAPRAGVEAAWAPGVGMAGCSLRDRGEELLGQRKGLAAYAETGSSMGVPLLHPWANRLSARSYRAGPDAVELDPERSPLRLDPNGLPIHGLLAASPHWRVEEATADEASARLAARLDFGRHPELLAAFPFPHELELTVRLAATTRGAELAVRLELRATGVVPVPLSFGFHPYLRLPGVERPGWEVRLPVRTRALLDERGLPTGATEPAPFTSGRLGDRALDDLFPELEPGGRFELSGGGRRLAVELREGYPVAQVFAPAGEPFVAFEPMTAPTDALVSGRGLRRVPPGGRFAAEFAIVLERPA